MLITFSGLDGAGKTTQIELFTQYLRQIRYRVKVLKMYDDISSAAILRKAIRKILSTPPQKIPRYNPTSYRNDKNRKDTGLVFLRKFAYAADLLIFILKRLQYQYFGRQILVMDRYLYDSAANLFKTYSDKYIRIFLNFIPKPDMAVFIDVDPATAFKRKPEYLPRFFAERRAAYKHIFKTAGNVSIVKSGTIDDTQSNIRELFKKALCGNSDDSFQYIDLIFKGIFTDKGTHINSVVLGGIDFDCLISALSKNCVTVRWLNNNVNLFGERYKNKIGELLKRENSRLNNAIELIGKVTESFRKKGLSIIVIKTLDNYPDLGHDVDLYTEAPVKQIDQIMFDEFNAKLERPTFSERLNKKRNYSVPGNTVLEIHCGRLGQMGEEVVFSGDLITNSNKIEIQGRSVYVPAPEYRLLLIVLQRIYRHFNIRICDFYNTIELIRNKSLDFRNLKKISIKYGLWEGVALYLSYLDKVSAYYGLGLNIQDHVAVKKWPAFIRIKNMHFRFPIFSTGLNVYSKKAAFEISKFNFYSLIRLALFIPFSLAHYISVKLFGKSRIWLL